MSIPRFGCAEANDVAKPHFICMFFLLSHTLHLISACLHTWLRCCTLYNRVRWPKPDAVPFQLYIIRFSPVPRCFHAAFSGFPVLQRSS